MMMQTTVLFVGEEPAIRRSLQPLVGQLGGCCFEAIADKHLAKQRLLENDLGMAIFHLSHSSEEADVLEFLSLAKRRRARLPVVVVSDIDDPASRVRFLDATALDCLTRPIDLSRLSLLMDLATAGHRFTNAASHVPAKSDTAAEGVVIDDFICGTLVMEDLVRQAQRISPLDTTILVTGETGTGKTSLARLIHQWSSRRDKPLVTVQCGALPPNLLESALFGHVRAHLPVPTAIK